QLRQAANLCVLASLRLRVKRFSGPGAISLEAAKEQRRKGFFASAGGGNRLSYAGMDNLITANIRQRPVRMIVCVAGIALGVCLVMLFTGLATGMSNDLQRRNSNLRAEILFTRPGAMGLMFSSPTLSTEYVARLKAVDGVAEAIPVAAYIFQDPNRAFGLERVDGVDWEPISKLNGLTLVAGQPPVAVDEVVIDEVKTRNDNYS